MTLSQIIEDVAYEPEVRVRYERDMKQWVFLRRSPEGDWIELDRGDREQMYRAAHRSMKADRESGSFF